MSKFRVVFLSLVTATCAVGCRTSVKSPGADGVEMPQRLGDPAAGSDGSSQLERCPPGPAP
jgi:hypothetical protein